MSRNRSFIQAALYLIICLSLTFSLMGSKVASALASTNWYVATTGADSNSCKTTGAPCLTINGAIGKAAVGDTINVAVGTYTGSGTEVALIEKSITLSGGWDATFTTQSGKSTIDGQTSRRGITVNGTLAVLIERFVVQNGFADYGGGIASGLGPLTLNNSLIRNNTASNNGGGIYHHWNGVLNINQTTVSNNTGGGILIDGDSGSGSTATLNNSRVESNSGYGISNFGSLVINNSTINNNAGVGVYNHWHDLTTNNTTISINTGSDDGGGLYNYIGSVVMNNTTISGNSAIYRGGGISVSSGTVFLNNSTVSRNATTSSIYGGGGIYNSGATVTLRNTLLASNTTSGMGPDCNGDNSIDSSGHNLIGNTSNCAYIPNTGDLIDINANLAPLGNYGGTTFTHALYANSPAINAGNPATPGSGGNACLATDQRGIARPKGSACDIGAYEGYLPIPIPLSPTGTISDTTPTYKWIKVPGATKYQFQLWKGTTLVYAKIGASSVCGATTCSTTPTTVLTNGIYKWRVKAMTGGVWKGYSAFKSFTLRAPKAGFWKSTTGEEFYVTPDQAKVANFTIYITVNGCGSYKITRTPLVSIVKNHFSFTGTFYASGTFSTVAKANGQSGLNNYYIAGCGYISGGPFPWSAIWKNGTQPISMSTDESLEIFVEPIMDAPSTFYMIESVDP